MDPAPVADTVELPFFGDDEVGNQQLLQNDTPVSHSGKCKCRLGGTVQKHKSASTGHGLLEDPVDKHSQVHELVFITGRKPQLKS